MAKKINKKISKNTFVIDGLINSDEKISKIIKKAKKKNIKSVSLVIDYNEEKKINNKKVKKRRKINKIEEKKDTKTYPLIEVKNESTENKNQAKLEITEKEKNNRNLDNFKDIDKEPKMINLSKQKIDNNKQKIDIKKINDKFVDINKTIAKLIEELKEDNKAKSVSIFINCDKKEKIKNKSKKKNKKSIAKKRTNVKKANKELVKKEKIIIDNKQNDVKVNEITKDQNIPKIEKENIEIKDLDTEELRILKIKTSKYFKIPNPFKSNNSKKNNKKNNRNS